MENDNTENIIMENEIKLLQKSVRNSKEELQNLISKDFLEYGSSGTVYTYNETIDTLLKQTVDVDYTIIKMNTKKLSGDIFLVLYAIKMNGKVSNRSSIWKKERDGWKILFHQGTNVE